MPGHEPTCPYTRGPAATGGWSAPDLSRARRLVAESGTTGSRVDVWGSRGWSEDVVRYAARLLRRLGYRARARFKPDIGQYFGYLAAPREPPQAGYPGWVADFLTPSNFIAPTLSCNQGPGDAAFNPSHFCDPHLESLIDRATAAEGAEANELWAEADRYIAGTAPVVPLVTRRSVLFVSDRVGNVQQHLQLGPLLDQMWVR
jgi:peptide/nickel transport system substrate-binding protein